LATPAAILALPPCRAGKRTLSVRQFILLEALRQVLLEEMRELHYYARLNSNLSLQGILVQSDLSDDSG
jgi:hypothetical protein